MISDEIKTLISRLQTKVDIYTTHLNQLRTLEVKKELLNEVISTLNNDNDYLIEDSTRMVIDMLLKELYTDNGKWIEVSANLYNTINRIDYYSNEGDNEKELEFAYNSYDRIMDKFYKYMNELNVGIKEISSLLNDELNDVIIAKKIISSFNFQREVDKTARLFLRMTILDNYNYSPKDKIILMEDIRDYNKCILGKNKNNKKSSISESLRMNYELIDDNYPKDDRLDNIVTSIYKSIKSLDDNRQIMSYLPSLNSDIYTEYEYNYIFTKLINKFANNLTEIQNQIVSSYGDYEIAGVLLLDIKQNSILYNRLKTIYRFSEKKQDVIPTIIKSKEELRHLFFAKANTSGSYALKDLDDMPLETLGAVEGLLSDFKYNQELGQNEYKIFKSINKIFVGMQELRGDQVRIVLYSLGNNNYIVVGIEQKKSDNDIVFYRKMANRNHDLDLIDYDSKYREGIEDYNKIIEYIEENKRISNRY